MGSAECHLTGVALRVLELGISELELAGLAAFLAWLGLGLARRKMVELALSLDRFLFQHSLGTVRQGATSRLIRTKRRLIGGWPTSPRFSASGHHGPRFLGHSSQTTLTIL